MIVVGRLPRVAAVIAATLLTVAACQRPPASPEAVRVAPSELPATTADRAVAAAPPADARTTATPQLASGASSLLEVADVAERAVQSIVNISTTRPAARNPMLDHPFFRELFKRNGQPDTPAPKGQSLGSGVIMTAAGIVVTNNHVIDGATDIRVTLNNGRDVEATVVGTDPKSDVAVLQLAGDLSGLEPIRFGNSDSLRLGEVVLAFGSPFGLSNTVTMGIISAKGRANMGIVDYEDFIQTDAAINPGNSGGALVNMQGELVGINTAIFSRSGGYQGIGFAIPSNMVRQVMDSLIEKGRVERGWLGVGIQDLNRDLAAALGVDSSQGVVVSKVFPASPADRAGLRPGDVVIEVAGRETHSTGQLRNRVAGLGAGARVAMTVLRDGRKKALTVTLGELPGAESEAVAPTPDAGEQDAAPGPLAGAKLAPLSDAARAEFRVPDDVRAGLVIVAIDPRSDVARHGLRPGDVIAEVNRTPVASRRDLEAALKKGREQVLLRVHRGPATMYLVMKP